LRLPEKLARNLVEEELPALDRPVRFVVIRGQRGAIRADSLNELQDLLDQPWSPDEVEASPYAGEDRSRDERRARDLASRRRQKRQRHQGGERKHGDRKHGERAKAESTGRKRRGGPRRKFRGR
jgi:ATP-dependent helicase HrpA